MELPDFVPERVSVLDPLGADDVCSRLPEMNARRDVEAMARTLSALLPSGPVLSGLSYDEGLAAMRDLGMFLASLKRHGVEPVGAVPGLEPVLIELGHRTDMVPRETIHHYSEMNPSDARQRTYTSDPMEAHAIDVVRIALRRYGTAIGVAERISDAEPHEAEFPLLLNDLADELGAFDASINLAHEKLAPTFFFDEFLPYTAEINVGGDTYAGPTAAHVPLAVIDMLVWESDHASTDLADYRLWALPYTMPRWRALRSRWATAPSLTTRVSAAITGSPAAAVHDSAAALTAVLRALVVFRGKHVAYARKGSSAEGVALLQDIIDQTRRMASLTRTGAAAATPEAAARHDGQLWSPPVSTVGCGRSD